MTKISDGDSGMSDEENCAKAMIRDVTIRRAVVNSSQVTKMVLVLAIIMVVASCASATRPPMRPQSTGKTIKTSSPAPEDNGPIIQSSNGS